MTVAEFAKRYDMKPQSETNGAFRWDHSLGSLARAHANHPYNPRVATAFDWEELERYREEMEQQDQENA